MLNGVYVLWVIGVLTSITLHCVILSEHDKILMRVLEIVRNNSEEK